MRQKWVSFISAVFFSFLIFWRPTVQAKFLPVQISFIPKHPKPGESISFKANSSVSNASILRVTWIFGDSSSGSGISIRHIYKKPGSYKIFAVIQYSDGKTAMGNRIIKIQGKQKKRKKKRYVIQPALVSISGKKTLGLEVGLDTPDPGHLSAHFVWKEKKIPGIYNPYSGILIFNFPVTVDAHGEHPSQEPSPSGKWIYTPCHLKRKMLYTAVINLRNLQLPAALYPANANLAETLGCPYFYTTEQHQINFGFLITHALFTPSDPKFKLKCKKKNGRLTECKFKAGSTVTFEGVSPTPNLFYPDKLVSGSGEILYHLKVKFGKVKKIKKLPKSKPIIKINKGGVK